MGLETPLLRRRDLFAKSMPSDWDGKSVRVSPVHPSYSSSVSCLLVTIFPGFFRGFRRESFEGLSLFSSGTVKSNIETRSWTLTLGISSAFTGGLFTAAGGGGGGPPAPFSSVLFGTRGGLLSPSRRIRSFSRSSNFGA